MAGQERFEGPPSTRACLVDLDCKRYSMCQLANGCRCQPSWGECVHVRLAGQPCHTDSQCAVGLICSASPIRSRCVLDNRLEEMPRFADAPDPDLGHPPDIPATYHGPLLVAIISLTLVFLCLCLTGYYRFTAPTSPEPREPQMHPNLSEDIALNHIHHIPPLPPNIHRYHSPSRSQAQ